MPTPGAAGSCPAIAKRHGVAKGEDGLLADFWNIHRTLLRIIHHSLGEGGHREITGEIAAAESPAPGFAALRRGKLALGRAAHCLILEGKVAFDEQYLVSDGPINVKTGEPYGKSTKSYSDPALLRYAVTCPSSLRYAVTCWLAAQPKEIIGTRDYGFITKLNKSVLLHEAASELLSDGAPEGVIRTEYCGVPCQIRMDWFSEKQCPLQREGGRHGHSP